MMNKLFTYLLALCTAACLYGCSEELEEMTSTEESPSNIVSRSIPESFSCGTIETDPPAWYFNTPRVFNNNSIYTLNIYIHVIRSSSGVGFNKEEVAQTVITNLNGYYASAKINFYLLGSDYIDSDRYNNSNDSYFDEICKQKPHINAVDIYVLSNGENWGRTAGRARMISSACVIRSYNYQDFAPAHELGHCFGLYHTHHGTAESGIPEFVNGSNSATAGDYMTDTPADPCEWNIFGEYIGTGTDANGDYYTPDPTNLMSYSWAYNQNRFSAEQIAKMRSIISQREEVSPTIHQKQIIGPKHFSNSGTYSLSVLNADESVRWEVTAYSENGSTKTTYTTSTLTLSSTQPTYYSIVASITSPVGTKSVTTHATCNEPSPYIGSLYWETNQGQYSITDATNYGGTLYVSGNINLSLEYRDKAGNTSDALPGVDFMCTTASNRLVRGKTFSLTPADCERDLYIRAKDACGTAESFFVIPCQVTNYYYDVNVALGEVAIGVVKTDNAEVNAILTAQKAKQAVVFNAATDVKIKSVVVYTENRQVLYSKEYAMGVSEIKIDAVSWASGVYHLSISNGTEVRHQKIMIP